MNVVKSPVLPEYTLRFADEYWFMGCTKLLAVDVVPTMVGAPVAEISTGSVHTPLPADDTVPVPVAIAGPVNTPA